MHFPLPAHIMVSGGLDMVVSVDREGARVFVGASVGCSALAG